MKGADRLRQPVASTTVDDAPQRINRQETVPWALLTIFTADLLKIEIIFGASRPS
jgi:hypothetical protein